MAFPSHKSTEHSRRRSPYLWADNDRSLGSDPDGQSVPSCDQQAVISHHVLLIQMVRYVEVTQTSAFLSVGPEVHTESETR